MLFGWMFAPASGYEIDPAWPWIILACYGPVCLLMFVYAIWQWAGAGDGHSRWQRGLMALWAFANFVIVSIPAIGRQQGVW